MRYDHVDCDEHPIGTNAVVAVITYTGRVNTCSNML